ncbi:MAG: FG-GAP repeat domain-containing protein, partial [Flavobacteriaceae bacterium]
MILYQISQLLVSVLLSLIGINDTDGDGISDENDNCIYIYNPNQEDKNNDGIGDICTWSDVLLNTSRSVISEDSEGYRIPLSDFIPNDSNLDYFVDISSFSDIVEMDNGYIQFIREFSYINERILKLPVEVSINGNTISNDTIEIRKINKIDWNKNIGEQQNGYTPYYYFSHLNGAIGYETEVTGPEQFFSLGAQISFLYHDLNNDGVEDIIGETQQLWTNRTMGRFNIARNGIPVYLNINHDFSISTYHEDKQFPDEIFHNADFFVLEDFDGDGSKELFILGEHYHNPIIDEQDVDQRDLARNIFKDLGYLENKDYNSAGHKLLRFYKYQDGRFHDNTKNTITNLKNGDDLKLSIFGHATGDIDNDGDLDLVLSAQILEGRILNVLINDGQNNFQGSFNFQSIHNYSSGPEGPNLLIDINQDGFLDYLFMGTVNEEGGKLGYLINNGNGGFDVQNPVFIPELFSEYGLSTKSIHQIDLVGDETNEIILYRSIPLGGISITDNQNLFHNEILVLKIQNNTLVNITSEVIPQYNTSRMLSNGSKLEFEDIDGDGLKDLTPVFFTDPKFSQWQQNNGNNHPFNGYWKPDYDGLVYFRNTGTQFILTELGEFQYSSEMNFVNSSVQSINMGSSFHIRDLDGDGVSELIHHPLIATNLIIFKKEIDRDSDGVIDGQDQCLDTPPSVPVDINGCEIFNLPNNNYTISLESLSCIGENDGSISIFVEDEDLNYTLRVNGENPLDLNSSEGYQQTLSNLLPGTYQLCFTVEGESGYNQCFDISITEPAPLSASSKVDKEGKSMSFSLEGSDRYTIVHNGVERVFDISNPEI